MGILDTKLVFGSIPMGNHLSLIFSYYRHIYCPAGYSAVEMPVDGASRLHTTI